jgi:hypothetical protein
MTVLTVCAIALHHATHAHGRSSLEQGTGDNGVRPRNGVTSTRDGQDAIVDALDDLGDASLDSSLVAEISNVLATLSDDDASFLGGHYSSEGELGLGVFLVRLRGRLAIRTETFVHLELVHRLENVGIVTRHHILRRHFVGGRIAQRDG